MGIDARAARLMIETLAQGIHPVTGEVMPEDSPYNAPPIIRALYVAVAALKAAEAVANKPPTSAAPGDSLIQRLMDASHAEGVACSIYEDEGHRQPFYERTHAARVALEEVTGEMFSALNRIAAEDPGGYFAAIALPAIAKAGGQQ